MTQCNICEKFLIDSSPTHELCQECLKAKDWDGTANDCVAEIIHWHWCDIANDRAPSNPKLLKKVSKSLLEDLTNKIDSKESWATQFMSLAESFVLDGGSPYMPSGVSQKVLDRKKAVTKLLEHCRQQENAKAIRSVFELLRLINWLEIDLQEL